MEEIKMKNILKSTKSAKMALLPTGERNTIPGKSVDTFSMYMYGDTINVYVMAVPAKKLQVSPGKSAMSKIMVSTMAMNDMVVRHISNMDIPVMRGDIIIFCASPFFRFSKKVQQIALAYEAAKLCTIYSEFNAENSEFTNNMAAEEATIQYLAQLDFSACAIMATLKKMTLITFKSYSKYLKKCKKALKDDQKTVMTEADENLFAGLMAEPDLI